MTRSIIIPFSQTKPIARADLGGLTDFQQAVDGWVEQITLHEQFALLVDEEGRIKNRPINRRATLLLRLYVPSARGSLAIVGDAILIGAPDAEAFGDVPDDLDQLLIETRQYVVRATSGADEVRSNPFGSFWNASELAIVADLDGTLEDVEVIPFE